jgi:uncharacterized protein
MCMSNAPECPLCGKPADAKYKPFCSRTCANRDLLAWLGDGYRLPGPKAEPDGALADDEG